MRFTWNIRTNLSALCQHCPFWAWLSDFLPSIDITWQPDFYVTFLRVFCCLVRVWRDISLQCFCCNTHALTVIACRTTWGLHLGCWHSPSSVGVRWEKSAFWGRGSHGRADFCLAFEVHLLTANSLRVCPVKANRLLFSVVCFEVRSR